MTLGAFREAFDPFLSRHLQARGDRALSVTVDPLARELVGHVHVLAAAGKRLRPYMAYLGYLSAGGRADDRIMSIGTGLELFHTFALVHDDIMDGDETRRGIKTIHTLGKEKLGSARLGDGMGILVGDLLFEWARELLPDAELAPYLSAMIDEVIIGQMLDVKLASKGRELTRAELDQMLLLKTASYSFIRPLQIGAAARGISPELEQFFAAFGKSLGFAFQLQDDYFDREGDAAQDRPSYYTRGFTEEGIAAMEKGFEEAYLCVKTAPLEAHVKQLFTDLLEGIRTRTS